MIVQIADVGGQNKVGRAVDALGLEPLEHPLFDINHVDLDTTLLGESIKQRVHQERLAT